MLQQPSSFVAHLYCGWMLLWLCLFLLCFGATLGICVCASGCIRDMPAARLVKDVFHVCRYWQGIFFSKCQALFNTSYVTIDRSRFFTPSSFGHIVRIVLDRRHKYRKYAKENGLTPSKRQICASNLSLPMKFSVSRKVTCGTASLHC